MSLVEQLGLTRWPDGDGRHPSYVVKIVGPLRIDLHLMLVNWRITISHADDWISANHGWCYFGASLETFFRAVDAAQSWDPLNEPEPKGYDKKAF